MWLAGAAVVSICGYNQKFRIALWVEVTVKAPRLSASAGLSGKEMGAETELYSSYKTKAAELPDMQKKEKQEKE